MRPALALQGAAKMSEVGHFRTFCALPEWFDRGARLHGIKVVCFLPLALYWCVSLVFCFA